MTNPPVFTWSDRFLLGHRTIDDTHREFVECVDALLRASDAEIPAALEAFIAGPRKGKSVKAVATESEAKEADK